MKVLALALAAIMLLPGCLSELQGRGGRAEPLDYLRDDDHTRWTIEVDYAEGQRPDASILELVRGRLSPLVHKPDGVHTVVDDSIASGRGSWTPQQIMDLSREHRDERTGGAQVATHLLFLAGNSASDTDDQKVLGVTIGWDVIAIFPETIRRTCSLATLCTMDADQITGAVTVHEFGHAMGLVHRRDGDGHIPVPKQSDHEDPQHPGHSRNEDSVMYWAVETDAVTGLLRGGLPTRFDAQDKADLCAAGGVC